MVRISVPTSDSASEGVARPSICSYRSATDTLGNCIADSLVQREVAAFAGKVVSLREQLH